MALPAGTGKSGLPFRQWCSGAWADVVDHPDPAQRARHLNAGTAVDIIAGVKGRDPKRLAIYFTKHAAPNSGSSKEYQHIVPDAWLQPGKGPGRFWGVAGLKRATVKVEIGRTDYINARRIVRRWSRAQAAYADSNSRFPTAVNPRTAKICVRRADSKTGRDTLRRVSRRRGSWGQRHRGRRRSGRRLRTGQGRPGRGGSWIQADSVPICCLLVVFLLYSSPKSNIEDYIY
jgi:hypothetical protein